MKGKNYILIALLGIGVLASCAKGPTSVSVNPSSLQLTEGETGNLSAEVLPEDAKYGAISWTSSDEAVATVSKSGQVTAIHAGTASITAMTEGIKGSATVTVKAKAVNVTEIVLSKTELSMVEGDVASLTATVLPENATNKNVSWRTSNSAVVTVDQTGKVTAVMAGEALVFASSEDGSKTASCKVIVTKKSIPVSSIRFDNQQVHIKVGDSAALSYTVEPENATTDDLAWTSSDESIATVDQNGTVTAVSPGRVTITVKTADGSRSASCSINAYDGDKAILSSWLLSSMDANYGYKSLVFNVNTDKTTENLWYREDEVGFAPVYYEMDGSTLTLYTSAECYVPVSSTLFAGKENLESVDLGNIDFSGLESAQAMFSRCIKLKSVNFRGTDFSNVKSFKSMFASCISLESLDLTGLDTSGAENMLTMFIGCTALKTLDLRGFNTSNVKDMSFMFEECTSLESVDLSSFDTRNVKNMSGMFYHCSSLESLDLTNFDTSNVVDVSVMFSRCNKLKYLDLSSFCLSPDAMVENPFASVGYDSGGCVVKCTPDAYLLFVSQAQYGNLEFDVIGTPSWYESTDFSQDGKVITLQKASSGQGVNLILMGDVYSDRKISDGTYHSDMQETMEIIFDVEPFKALRNLFNVYEVDVVSKNEFISELSETAFEATKRPHGSGILYDCNLDKVVQYAQKALPSKDVLDEAIVVVMVNSDESDNVLNQAHGITYLVYPKTPTDYGSGLSVAIIGMDNEPDFHRHLIQHECGHAIGKLADEYQHEDAASDYVRTSLTNSQNNYGWYRNVSVTPDLEKVPWKDFIGDSRYASEEIGAYEGAYEYASGIWRPTRNSMMREDDMCCIFNAPSRALIYYRLNKIAYGKDWEYDYEKFVEFDKPNWGISFKPASGSKASKTASRTAPYRGPAPVIHERRP